MLDFFFCWSIVVEQCKETLINSELWCVRECVWERDSVCGHESQIADASARPPASHWSCLLSRQSHWQTHVMVPSCSCTICTTTHTRTNTHPHTHPHTHTHTHARVHQDLDCNVCIHHLKNIGSFSPPKLHSKFSLNEEWRWERGATRITSGTHGSELMCHKGGEDFIY
jgi:hypothetical protein